MISTRKPITRLFVVFFVAILLFGCGSSEVQEPLEQEVTTESQITKFPTVVPEVEPQETGLSNTVKEPVKGQKVLYIGHSFGRPFAQKLSLFAEMAGVDNHIQEIVFRGGSNGNPQALWENTEARLEIQNILDNGDIDLLVMICCSDNFKESRETDWASQNWIDYALSANPDTDFALALPWVDYPSEYANNEAFSGRMIAAHESAWHPLIDNLRELYPGSEIQSIFHGKAAFDLRELFESDSLPEVSEMTLKKKQGQGLFTDYKGHAGQILLDLGTLVWLGSIYDVDLDNFPADELKIGGEPYVTDLIAMAQEILDYDNLIDAG
jgi:hypothetical protein